MIELSTKSTGTFAWSAFVRIAFFLCAGPILVQGCSGTDSTGLSPVLTTAPYALLRLNVRGVVMSTIAPYDTLQLIPTAYDGQGNAISLPGSVTYTVSDTTLNVSASGLITLKTITGASSYVIASVQDTILRLTHADTAFILGTATAPTSPLASVSIHPVGTDSAVLDLKSGTKTLTVTALDATGNVIPRASLNLHFGSGNISVATIDASRGNITAVSPGTSRLTASLTYYGVTKVDSLPFRVGYPDTTSLTLKATVLADGSYQYSWTAANRIIGVGKTVIFRVPYFVLWNPTVIQLQNVPTGARAIFEGMSAVFDDSTAVEMSPLPTSYLTAQHASNGSGNVSLQVPDSFVVADSSYINSDGSTLQFSHKLANYCLSSAFPCATARAFPTAGTYHFHSVATGAVGTITVVGQ